MKPNTTRILWLLTALAALLLLGATAMLALREGNVAGPATIAGDNPGVEPIFLTDQEPKGLPPRPNPAVAGNGLIAFSSDRDGDREIYVMQPDGSGQKSISEEAGIDASPAWSGDGSRLFWAHIGESGDWSIRSALPDGSDRQTHYTGGNTWLQTGAIDFTGARLLLYMIEDGDGNGELSDEDPGRLLLIDTRLPEVEPADLLAGRDAAVLRRQANFPPPWSPDGATLYGLLQTGGRQGLFSLPAGGGEPDPVVEGNIELAALSHDGRRLALWQVFEDTGRSRRRLVIHDLAGGQSTPMLMGGLGFSEISTPRWNRDGTRLLFMGFTGNSAPDIYSLDVARDQLLNLTGQVADPAFMPEWSPDGLQVVFMAQSYRAGSGGFVPAGDANLFLVDDLGGAVRQLTGNQGNNDEPAWQPLFR